MTSQLTVGIPYRFRKRSIPILLYEPFDYSSGELNGVSAGLWIKRSSPTIPNNTTVLGNRATSDSDLGLGLFDPTIGDYYTNTLYTVDATKGREYSFTFSLNTHTTQNAAILFFEQSSTTSTGTSTTVFHMTTIATSGQARLQATIRRSSSFINKIVDTLVYNPLAANNFSGTCRVTVNGGVAKMYVNGVDVDLSLSGFPDSGTFNLRPRFMVGQSIFGPSPLARIDNLKFQGYII